MGAGTSGLQRDVSNIETKFAVHEAEYKAFPSGEGEKLRTEFDAHLSSYAKGELGDTRICEINLSCPLDGRYANSSDLATLQASVGARATAGAGGTAAPATGLFLDVQGKADQAGVTTLAEAVGRAPASEGGAAATGLFGQVTTLTEAVGRPADGGAAATGLFTKVARLTEFMEQFESTAAAGDCEVTLQCPLDSSYASFSDLATLQASVGKAAGGAPATGLFQQVGGLATSVGRAATGGAAATGLFQHVEVTRTELGALGTAVGRAATADSTAAPATGLFLAMQGKADQVGVATLSAAVGNAAAGGSAATGLFQQMAVNATQATELEARVASLERAPVHACRHESR